MMSQLQDNPMFRRAKEMSNGKSTQENEATAKNLCEQMGIDYSGAKAAFEQQTGIKL